MNANERVEIPGIIFTSLDDLNNQADEVAQSLLAQTSGTDGCQKQAEFIFLDLHKNYGRQEALAIFAAALMGDFFIVPGGKLDEMYVWNAMAQVYLTEKQKQHLDGTDNEQSMSLDDIQDIGAGLVEQIKCCNPGEFYSTTINGVTDMYPNDLNPQALLSASELSTDTQLAVGDEPESVSPILDAVIAYGIQEGINLSRQIREAILAALVPDASVDDNLDKARAVLKEYEPALAQSVSNAILAGWLHGGSEVASRMGGDMSPPSLLRVTVPGGEPPPITYPLIDAAVANLQSRRILRPSDYYAADAEAKAKAFTVTGVESERILEGVRDLLAKDVQEGGKLETFKYDLESIASLTPGHAECVYRTNISTAYTAGMDAVLDHPLVKSTFPFIETLPIRDSRLTDICHIVSQSGLDGTGVYYRKDSEWQRLKPPRHFQCFPAGTEIEGKFDLGFKTWYEGKLIEITTRNGYRLSVTANHPILADHGFASADSLCQGDYLVSYCRRAKRQFRQVSTSTVMRSGSVSRNKHNGPALIENIFSSLENFGRIGSFPTAANDFDGDGEFTNGHVEIVGSDRSLLIDCQAAGSYGVCNRNLALMDMNLSGMTRNGFSPFGNIGRLLPHIGGGGFSDPSSVFFRVRNPDRSNGQCLNFGEGANLYASFDESVPNNRIAAPVLFRQTKERFAADVSFGHVGNINIDNSNPYRTPLKPINLLFGPKNYPGSAERMSHSAPTDSGFVGKFIDRFAGLVSLDKITDIRESYFSGHVYDLQSPFGLMIANSIVASNCRCGQNPLTIEQAAERGVKYAAEWLHSGLQPKKGQFVKRVPVELDPRWANG